MATRIPNDNYRAPQSRPAGTRPASGTARPAGTRPASGASRPAARPASGTARPAARPATGYRRPASAGARPAARPSGASPRPSAPRPGGQPPRPRPKGRGRRRQRRVNPRFFLILAVLAIIIVLVIVLVGRGGKKDNATTLSYQNQIIDQTAAQPAEAQPAEQTPAEQTQPVEQPEALSGADLAAQLADSDAEVQALAAEDMAQVENLGVHEGLPEEWLNVLLLGTDERTLTESPRTDCMMICSVNRNTGEVKLTSIMRDTDVEIKGTKKYDGHYRINSANYFGGWKLAVRTVNELLDMNIQYYAIVNFFGFQKIAHILGGIEADITEAEMEEINYRIYEQAKMAYDAGIDESDLADENKVYVESYGKNIHLNARQTLAYARIRKTDNDYARTERQQLVLSKLLEKLKGQGASTMLTLANTVLTENMIKTNMPFDEITAIALKVLTAGMPEIKGMRIPVNGTYVEERRNDDARLYDTDWAANATQLYSFIYG